jgi:transposase
MKQTIFTEEEKISICDKFKQGLSGAEIAKELNQPRFRIYEVLRKYGFKPKDNFKQIKQGKPEELQEKIVEYYQTSDIRNTGKNFNIPYGTVRKILMKRNVLRLDNGQKLISEELAKECVKDWQLGMSQTAIAKKYNVSQAVIGRTLWKQGIQTSKRLRFGEKHGSYKGGKGINNMGYVQILMPKDHKFYKEMALSHGYVLEHRFKMAESLGRPLTKDESVHHVDGNKQNNDISNLQLRKRNHGQGIVMKCRCCGSTDIESIEI